jgi:hypothetical protein
MIDKVEFAFAQLLKALFALCASLRGLGFERRATLSGRRELGALLGQTRSRFLEWCVRAQRGRKKVDSHGQI